MSARTSPTSIRQKNSPAEAEVRITGIAAGGAGVGRLADGQVVFVPLTAPGDLVRIAIAESRTRWAKGTLIDLVESANLRRSPPCPYFGRCGGCALEHLEYPAQLAAKAQIVTDALRRIGSIEVDPPTVTPSPRQFRYRNRISITLRRSPDGLVGAGFRGIGAPQSVVDVDGRCLLPEEALAEGLRELRARWGPAACLLPSGPELRLTLRSSADGSLTLLVRGGTGPGAPEELLRRIAALRSVWHAPHGGTWALLAGDASLRERWGEEWIELGADAFLQVNRWLAPELECYALSQLGNAGGARVVDAFCGIGLYARRLARDGATVVGIDRNTSAINAARAAAPPGATFIVGDASEQLPKVLPADAVILNPPRSGIAAETATALRQAPPARLVYISCDPATLARDLKRLAPVLQLDALRAFDLFPQTAHVETVATLSSSAT